MRKIVKMISSGEYIYMGHKSVQIEEGNNGLLILFFFWGNLGHGAGQSSATSMVIVIIGLYCIFCVIILFLTGKIVLYWFTAILQKSDWSPYYTGKFITKVERKVIAQHYQRLVTKTMLCIVIFLSCFLFLDNQK